MTDTYIWIKPIVNKLETLFFPSNASKNISYIFFKLYSWALWKTFSNKFMRRPFFRLLLPQAFIRLIFIGNFFWEWRSAWRKSFGLFLRDVWLEILLLPANVNTTVCLLFEAPGAENAHAGIWGVWGKHLNTQHTV